MWTEPWNLSWNIRILCRTPNQTTAMAKKRYSSNYFFYYFLSLNYWANQSSQILEAYIHLFFFFFLIRLLAQSFIFLLLFYLRFNLFNINTNSTLKSKLQSTLKISMQNLMFLKWNTTYMWCNLRLASSTRVGNTTDTNWKACFSFTSSTV